MSMKGSNKNLMTDWLINTRIVRLEFNQLESSLSALFFSLSIILNLNSQNSQFKFHIVHKLVFCFIKKKSCCIIFEFEA